MSATVFGGEEVQKGGDSAERHKSSYRAVLEKKLSIAERAVATNPLCIALQLERLRICQELWEPSVLAKEWKKLVSLQSLYVSVVIRGMCNEARSLFLCCIPGVPPPKQRPLVERVFALHPELLQ